MAKLRLDLLLVARGLAESRTKAQALIMAGLVYHGEQKLDKAGAEFAEDYEINVRGKEHPWVSRGGMKLAKAIEHFSLDVKGAVAMDVGASTGGFTDVLLTHGAAKVYAVDVGHGQLDVKLRNDSRVVVMEETNARHLTAEMIAAAESKLNIKGATSGTSPLAGEERGLANVSELSRSGEGASDDALHLQRPPTETLSRSVLAQHGSEDRLSRSARVTPPQGGSRELVVPPQPMLDVIVCDASFISLTKVLPAALALAKTGAQLITLIKPQFEVGKVEVSRGKGVIRDAGLHQQVCDTITSWITGEGWQVVGITTSPITGPKGNVEFLLVAKKSV